jgi:manganese efflux pump family protein
MLALKMIALILSLGIDTLIVSTSLGVLQVKGKWKIGLTFALAEAVMPTIGLFIGRWLGQWFGVWTSLVGGLALAGLAVWLLFFDDDDDERDHLARNITGWTLLLTALGISLDELAVGFSIGLIGVPVILTIGLIALQAFVFSILGLTYGRRLQPFLGAWSQRAAGIVLGLLGLWIVGESITTMVLLHHTY